MTRARFIAFATIIFFSLHFGHAEESQEDRGKNRGVDTLYSSDVADMNFNIDSPPLKGEIFPETRKRLLTVNDIKGWPDAKLQYAINEMYARRNANFGNKNVKKFFLAFEWYTPIAEATLDAVEMHFSAIETSNLKLLGEARQNFKASSAGATPNDKPHQQVTPTSTSQLSVQAAENPPVIKSTPTPTHSGKSFDEIMKENDNWASQGMKHDAATGGLNLVTTLPGGPSSLELEKLLQLYIEYNLHYYPLNSLTQKQWDAVKTTYEMKQAHNIIKSAKVTNEYTKTIDGEKAYIYELDLTLTYSLANVVAHTYVKEGSTVEIVLRGKKWYIEAMDN